MEEWVRYSQEVKARAVKFVFESIAEHGSQWAAMVSVASKIGCTSERLRRWVRQQEKDFGKREGTSTDEKARIRELEQENRELRKANEVLGLASAYFAQAELDRRSKLRSILLISFERDWSRADLQKPADCSILVLRNES